VPKDTRKYYLLVNMASLVVQYCSDLHLEFRENREFLETHPLEPRGDILLLGGDIVPFGLLEKYAYFFDYVADNFERVYWLPGNHEYYRSDLAGRSGCLEIAVRPNVFLVNDTIHVLGTLRLVFSTLWSRISPRHERLIERSMSDFHLISYEGRRFSTPQFNQLHASSLDFLHQGVRGTAGSRTVVLTHHVPTFMRYPEKYRGSVLSEAFGVELFDLIDAWSPDHWIYGHHHCNIPDFTIGRTTLHTNQLGYVQYGEQQGFDPGKVLTI
jgi:predicted phosphohydrolase